MQRGRGASVSGIDDAYDAAKRMQSAEPTGNQPGPIPSAVLHEKVQRLEDQFRELRQSVQNGYEHREALRREVEGNAATKDSVARAFGEIREIKANERETLKTLSNLCALTETAVKKLTNIEDRLEELPQLRQKVTSIEATQKEMSALPSKVSSLETTRRNHSRALWTIASVCGSFIAGVAVWFVRRLLGG